MRLLAATLVSFLCVPVDALRPSTRADGLRMSGSGDTAINRRAALLRPALFATGVASIPLVANAGDLYVTQEEFCKRTMTERGASYGCEVSRAVGTACACGAPQECAVGAHQPPHATS